MLSVLIPIYNFNVTNLVHDLHQQCVDLAIPFEIRCYDDGSTTQFLEQNKSIEKLENVVLIELQKNLGRAAIRNLLSKEAAFDHQIFMDCDSATKSDKYIKTFWENRNIAPVIFGGRIYKENKPAESKKNLRWIYGTKREVFDAETRMEKPYKYFMTNNFWVERKVVEQVPFHENLIGYGHEDTVFAQDLKAKNITVKHINNPLYHIGLEDAEEFLQKTTNGVKNLAQLIKSNQIDSDNRLFSAYQTLKKLGLSSLVLGALNIIYPNLERNLLSSNPSLRFFDLYKLRLLLQNMKVV